MDETALQQFGGLSFSLEKGDYKLYLLGEGAEASFAHTIPEVTRPGSTADVWYKTIRFQPVKREVFHAVKDIRVDGKGGDISLDTALDRKNGTVEIACTLPDNSCEVLSMVLLVPDGYLANAMKADGSLTFVEDTNGTGYFWTYAVRPGTDGIYRVQMLPSLPYKGTIKPRIILTYKQNGNVENAEIALDVQAKWKCRKCGNRTGRLQRGSQQGDKGQRRSDPHSVIKRLCFRITNLRCEAR